ncbi:FHA domain protein [Synechococcus sp. PCC 7335]|uniref:FHA domain-containing protein n=1 Tax=Synechococcus sp. (strain ATCC 29403 / PCC 7335) TaxID=91464 RepID=UPI00017EB510|nr:FHA domain-containing protein [Synechococcus sp. PCC 7335]EDX84789.1 FHA domain protein [Synechococcus sp. PCC 7335]
MITCPNCNHQNPDGALQCEACYTPLPALVTCPSCQALVQANSSFCGQCGHDLRESAQQESAEPGPAESFSPANTESAMSEVALPEPNSPEPVTATPTVNASSVNASIDQPDSESFSEFSQSIDFDESVDFGTLETTAEPAEESPESATGPTNKSTVEPEGPLPASVPTAPLPASPLPTVLATQIQAAAAVLTHVQTGTSITLPSELSVVRIGKPNEHTQPDIDISGFPNSEIVSRVHANLLIEGDVYYLEDVGSSNGTYINGLPLPAGNRHRLNIGDRIALGKGDKVSFVFEAARH